MSTHVLLQRRQWLKRAAAGLAGTALASEFLVNPAQAQYGNVDSLEAALRASIEGSSQIADVVITVTDFRDVFETLEIDRGSLHELSMGAAHRRVYIDYSGEIPTLKVKHGVGPVMLRFRIVDKRTDEIYYPLGISFQQLSSTSSSNAMSEKMVDSKNFPLERVHLYGGFIYITDFFMPEPVGTEYEFTLFFQRGSDGALGLIDPPIQNEN